jgi:hypothetical protein
MNTGAGMVATPTRVSAAGPAGMRDDDHDTDAVEADAIDTVAASVAMTATSSVRSR